MEELSNNMERGIANLELMLLTIRLNRILRENDIPEVRTNANVDELLKM